MLVVTLRGPDAVVGIETVSVVCGEEIVTVMEIDKPDSTDVWLAHRAFAITAHVPAVVQIFEALVTPTGSHPELVPIRRAK